MKFKYEQNDVAMPITKFRIEVPFIYRNEVQKYDKTYMKSSSVKLYFYSSKDEKLTVMEVNEFEIKMWNDDWHQIGKYLIAKQPMFLQFEHAQLITDSESIKEIKQIIEDNEYLESFIAIETKFKLQKSLPSK